MAATTRRRATGPENRDQGGFTLLELIIAMLLTGMVMAVLYGGFRLGINSWDRGDARATRLNEVRMSQDFLRRQLRQSVTVYRNDEREGRIVYFDGRGDRIGWVAPMLRYLGMGGLYYIELDRAGDPEDGQLRLRWAPYNPANEEDVLESDGVEQTVLLTGVTDFGVEYFGPEDDTADPDWHDEWTNVNQRPELIRIRVGLRDSEWPTLNVGVLN